MSAAQTKSRRPAARPPFPVPPVKTVTAAAARRALADPLRVRAHHLACAVCARGGCATPPPGRRETLRILNGLWEFPFRPVRVEADVGVSRVSYRDLYAKAGKPPAGLSARIADYVGRRKDLEFCRTLGIVPNTELPAYLLYSTLFARRPTLAGLCRNGTERSEHWPECPYARKGYYERIAQGRVFGLDEQTTLGEGIAGHGIWAMVRPRTRAEMKTAKQGSAAAILKGKTRLFVRPHHLLCLLCQAEAKKPLVEDNLIELRMRMEREPEVPVTLVEGCCQVCDACNIFHPGANLCHGTDVKDPLRDLMLLEKLDLPPGATLPARELYRRIYERLGSMKEVCGWGDGSNTALWWAPCGRSEWPGLEEARSRGLLVDADAPKVPVPADVPADANPRSRAKRSRKSKSRKVRKSESRAPFRRAGNG